MASHHCLCTRQRGFSAPLFSLGLAALTLAFLLTATQFASRNLSAWAVVDNPHARTLLARETPSVFLIMPSMLDAQIDVMRREGSAADMRRAHLQRLSRAPANARYWSRYAIDLQRFGETGADLEHAVMRALALAPHSRVIALEQSVIAAYNWNRVSAELQASWRDAFQIALTKPRELAWLAIQSQVATPLCDILSTPHALEVWCTRLPAYRQACQSDQLTVEQQQWCRSMGL